MRRFLGAFTCPIRRTDLRPIWLRISNWGGSSYNAGIPIVGNNYVYEPYTRLRTAAKFYVRDGATTNWVQERQEDYAYDPELDYLTWVGHDDVSGGSYESSNAWTYDAAGNRASDASQGTGWTYDNLNRMTASPGYTYTNDILGNRTGRNYTQYYNANARLYSWDVLNRMTATAGVSASSGARYEYRADGMRTLKVGDISLSWVENPVAEDGSGWYDQILTTSKPTTRYYYDGQMAVEEDFTTLGIGEATVTVTRNGIGARGIDYLDKTVDGSPQGSQFPLYDGHGNMVSTIARSGTNSFTRDNRRTYDVWGGVRSTTNPDAYGGPKARYCANLGHVQDDESSLIYMRARYYEPWTGRFVSEDPGRDSRNWFIYCGNDPVNMIDGSGKDTAEAIFWSIISAILMITAVLLGFGEANLTMAIARAARDAAQLESMYGAGLAYKATLDRALGRLRDLERTARNYRVGARSSLVGSILARALFFEALLIDIDIAADGRGGLEIVFGEG